MIEVKVSKYCSAVNRKDNCFNIGDIATLQATIPGNKNCRVIINSPIKFHRDAPRDGQVIEVIFLDDPNEAEKFKGKLFAVSYYRLIPMSQTEKLVTMGYPRDWLENISSAGNQTL